LASLGIPGFVVSLILSSSETVVIKQPDEPTGNWTMVTTTGLNVFTIFLQRHGDPM
jgi:hypothetical protein